MFVNGISQKKPSLSDLILTRLLQIMPPPKSLKRIYTTTVINPDTNESQHSVLLEYKTNEESEQSLTTKH